MTTTTTTTTKWMDESEQAGDTGDNSLTSDEGDDAATDLEAADVERRGVADH